MKVFKSGDVLWVARENVVPGAIPKRWGPNLLLLPMTLPRKDPDGRPLEFFPLFFIINAPRCTSLPAITLIRHGRCAGSDRLAGHLEAAR